MKFFADLHIHSSYSMATSRQITPQVLDGWARIKGISLLGTGDCTHRGWLAELKEKLVPAEEGSDLYRLSDRHRLTSTDLGGIRVDGSAPVRFMLSGEISSIYKKGGKVRKVHNLVFFPHFEGAELFADRLEERGCNISSDGRPIIGMDSAELFALLLEVCPRAQLVPAHIWTPWFSVLGSKSGFDSLEECYGDLTGQILAVETGLSSDPPMNRICSILDRFALISNSDAHSPGKLGREANVFRGELTWNGVWGALGGTSRDTRFDGTLEFFPQEGKYHLDGHRKCGVSLDPFQTKELGGICPVCGKSLTLGVLHRVIELADRDEPRWAAEGGKGGGGAGDVPFRSMVSLDQLLAEMVGVVSPTAKRVQTRYRELIRLFGSEFQVLLQADLADLAAEFDPLLAEAVGRVRAGKVHKEDGYDGAYGKIRVFAPGELGKLSS